MEKNFQEIRVMDAFESPTNPRGKDFEGKAFDDLIASIQEKGILVPVMARKRLEEGGYEIIAGNRRFRAAIFLGLETIPAEVMELSDEEAQEIQIIENLQREDVHPIDEGISYRHLIEESGYDIATIAIRVGKSDTYVRQRLFLTNLSKKAAEVYRNGKIKNKNSWGKDYKNINDSHMVVIGRLSHNDQDAVLKFIAEEREDPTVKEIKEWIQEHVYDVLSNQPWLKDKEAMEAVGACVECKPDQITLFGGVKEGACTDIKCWKRKMERYISWKMEKNNIKVKISKEYGYSYNPELSKKDILYRNGYETMGKKKCEYAKLAIVASGEGLGAIMHICRDSKCKIHSKSHTEYAPSPEEKEKRRENLKEEKIKAEERKQAEDETVRKAVEKVTNPIDAKTADAMINVLVKQGREEWSKDIAVRRGWDPIIREEKNWMDTSKIRKVKDWRDTIKEKAKDMSIDDRVKLIFELLIQMSYLTMVGLRNGEYEEDECGE